MADEQGADNTQNSQGAEEPKPDTSKIFSNGYNQGREKEQKDVLSKFESITGQKPESVDQVFEWMTTTSKKVAESISDPTQTNEYKELQGKLSTYQEKLQQAQSRAEQVQNQYHFDSAHNETANKLRQNAEFVIPDSDAKQLFQTKHEIEWNDGKAIVKKDGAPLLDDNGNYRPLQSVLTDFYKSYTKPTTQGTGGGTGDGVGKPKFADFKQASKGDNRKQMAELINQAKAAGGWQESDAPAI